MNDARTCLKNVVGIVPASCVCTEEGRPADYATSLSGHYMLDRGFGMTFDKVNSLKFVDGVTIWDFLEATRAQAINFFFADLARNIPTGMRAPYTKHDGFIGAIEEWSTGLSVTGPRVGFALVPVLYKGMAVKIRGFRLFCPGLEDGVINIHRSTDILKGDVTPFKTITYTGVAPDIKQLDIPTGDPILIDLEDQYGKPVTIYFSYLPGANAPLNTKFFCGTCGIPAWYRLFHPKVINMADNLAAFQAMEMVRTCSYQQYNNGLAVDLSLSCSDGWICSEWNYSSDWPRVMADCLNLYNQRELRLACLQRQIAAPKLIFGREETFKEVEKINSLLIENMLWLGVNIPVNMSDCYVCDERMVVGAQII